jgi:hypothetical protein
VEDAPLRLRGDVVVDQYLDDVCPHLVVSHNRVRHNLHVQCLGFRVQDSGFSDQCAGFRVKGSWFRVQGSEFRV